MRTVRFYRTESGQCPVVDFLDALDPKQAAKVTWVLRLIEELSYVPRRYFQKLVDSDDIWEIRVDIARDTFRLLSFFDGSNLVVIDHAFAKKTRKTPRSDIRLAEKRRQDYFMRKRR
ncbi:MAG: type II toxin-antitoxin system RelE/ParE family toxin [Gemmatimonadetes bacterium]|nr:type II toxin-antitoxin system RelE/ParE family toxin [Gemmatimonadota bacterium]MYB62418.1 type II toxin-antitoxin system RelE/ParE family toxin [Gemmatimonadota bacterium]